MKFITYKRTDGVEVTYRVEHIGVAWFPANYSFTNASPHGLVILDGCWAGGEIDRQEYERLLRITREQYD